MAFSACQSFHTQNLREPEEKEEFFGPQSIANMLQSLTKRLKMAERTVFSHG
jgi:hypothetical protein